MPYITAKKLQQLLEPSAGIAENNKIHVSHSNKGPGEMDKWASLLEGKDNCWQQRNTSAKKVTPKKKIILSNHFLRSDMSSVELHRFINALLDNYEVYFWPGDKINFDSIKPLNNLAEFWEKRSAITVADQQDVKKALSAQGIATDNYHIIDDERCFKIVNDLAKDYEYISTFSKQNVIDYTTSKPTNYDHQKITSAVSKNLEDHQIAEMLSCPNLKTVDLINLNEHNYINDLNKLSGKQLNLTLIKPKLSSYECHDNQYNQLTITSSTELHKIIINEPSNINPENSTRLQQLTIEDCENLSNLEISPEASLNELTISKCRGFVFNLPSINHTIKKLNLSYISVTQLNYPEHSQLHELNLDNISDLNRINLSNCKNLKQLTITSQDKYDEIIFPNPNNIEHLKLTMRLNNIDLSSFSKLKKLTLTGSGSIGQLDLSKFPDLEEIELDGVRLTTPLDLSFCKKIKQIKISNTRIDCENTNNIFFGELTTLKSINLYGTNIKNLDLSQCTHVEDIYLDECYELTSINIDNLSNLKKIETKKQKIPDDISMKNCSNVTILTLKKTLEQQHLDLSLFPNLEQITLNVNNTTQLTQLSSSCPHLCWSTICFASNA